MEEEVTDDQGGEGYEEETPIPKIIPEEYLQEVLVKSIEVCINNLKAFSFAFCESNYSVC